MKTEAFNALCAVKSTQKVTGSKKADNVNKSCLKFGDLQLFSFL